jgi:hypothetical protein
MREELSDPVHCFERSEPLVIELSFEPIDDASEQKEPLLAG